MSASWKLGFVVLALLACGSLAGAAETTVAAQDPAANVKIKEAPSRLGDVYYSTTKGPFYYQNEYELRSRKLARGFANVILCPAEIPNQMFREAYKSSPVSGGVVGIWKGFLKGGKRLFIGTWEIVTFYHPGTNHYQPYVEPEVVFMEYIH
jgi:putative exosortase-associated protein (TIGR04073 family)